MVRPLASSQERPLQATGLRRRPERPWCERRSRILNYSIASASQPARKSTLICCLWVAFLAKAVDAAITGIKVRHAQVVRKHSVRLEQNMREKIRELINKIKITIEGIELPLLRKEALMAKLNAFAAEVDRDRTRSEAFGALIIEIAGGAAKVERKLRPIRKWLDSIARVMHEARVHEDTQGRLPPPIQAPQKQISPPSREAPKQPPKTEPVLDDHLPF
jgi:hypothetical protein